LDESKNKITRDHGFGILLEYDGCYAPKAFAQWLANQADLNCGDIVIGGGHHPFFCTVSPPILRDPDWW